MWKNDNVKPTKYRIKKKISYKQSEQGAKLNWRIGIISGATVYIFQELLDFIIKFLPEIEWLIESPYYFLVRMSIFVAIVIYFIKPRKRKKHDK